MVLSTPSHYHNLTIVEVVNIRGAIRQGSFVDLCGDIVLPSSKFWFGQLRVVEVLEVTNFVFTFYKVYTPPPALLPSLVPTAGEHFQYGAAADCGILRPTFCSRNG